jgi:AhpD family alkylhydroperoxidase
MPLPIFRQCGAFSRGQQAVRFRAKAGRRLKKCRRHVTLAIGYLVLDVTVHSAPKEKTMTPRIKNPFKSAPDGIKAMMALEASIQASGLDHALGELVKMRASQINGCAYCLHMHATDARAHGETEMRLYMLNAWRESPLYSDRERAALAWTEALTRVADTGAPDADYDGLDAFFDEAEKVQLTLLIGAINLWNRLQIGLRAVHPVDESRAAA